MSNRFTDVKATACACSAVEPPASAQRRQSSIVLISHALVDGTQLTAAFLTIVNCRYIELAGDSGDVGGACLFTIRRHMFGTCVHFFVQNRNDPVVCVEN
jgi:hypothetical protein